MNNIVLIGMPGSGKTTLGKELAKKYGMNFIDGDTLIEEREQRSLAQIIAQEGIEGFLSVENEVLSSIHTKGSVIAPGGSCCYSKPAMEHFRKIGLVVYLEVSYEDLEGRLGNLKERGVVLREGQSLRDLFEERDDLYQKYAQLVFEEKALDETESLSGLDLLIQEEVSKKPCK